MAVKAIASANTTIRNVEELTGIWAETIQNTVFISQPSPLYYFLGRMTHLMPADMIRYLLAESPMTSNALAGGLPIENETPSFRYEPAWASTALILAPIQDLLDRFVNRATELGPVPMSAMRAVEGLVANLLRQQCRIAGTVTEDGILALETRLGSEVQLFVEVDRDGGVDASIFEPGVGIRGLDVATISDLEAKLISSNPS